VYLYDIDEATVHPQFCAADRGSAMIFDKQLPTLRVVRRERGDVRRLEKWLANSNPDESSASTTSTHDYRRPR
jgi:hypothetical protein